MANVLTAAALAPLAGKLGGIAAINRLDYSVIRDLLTFPGDILVVTKDFYEFTINRPRGGYDIYDRYMRYSYSVAYDTSQADLYNSAGMTTEVPQMTFGKDLQDSLFMSTAPHGSLFYLSYKQVRGNSEMSFLICVVISPMTRAELNQMTEDSNLVMRVL